MAKRDINSPTYRSWSGARTRCYNKNSHDYKYHGAMGVKMCERWDSFDNFLADMGERPPGTSIDRHPDPWGDYAPGNCRWATTSQQSAGRRNATILEVGCFYGNPKEWCDALNLNLNTVNARLRHGWTAKEAICGKGS